MAATATAARSIETLLSVDYYELPEPTSDGVVCPGCTAHERAMGRTDTIRHASADHVDFCRSRTADMDAEAKAEIDAEGAWLRAAEAGTPDTWADEDRDRAIEALGYGPPAGF